MTAHIARQPKVATPPRTPTFSAVRGGLLQRKYAYGNTSGPNGEYEASQKARMMLQGSKRKGSFFGSNPAEAPPVAYEVLRSPGQPLDAATREFAESRFGHDFGLVRIHDDQRSSRAADSLRAAAFTLGNHIVFGANRYAPATAKGQLLLQHELRHVSQQRSATAVESPAVDSPHSVQERDARRILDAHVEPLAEQRIQCAPEDVEFSLGGGVVDSVGKSAFGDTAWPFLKAVFEGFVAGLQADIKAGRADAAKIHLLKLFVPWNAAKFYAGYLLGLVIGLVSPITDLVKGIIGVVKLAISALQWLVKWSPIGVATNPERQRKIARLIQKFADLPAEFDKALKDFVADPKGTVKKFAGFLDSLMQMALGKAHDIGAKAAHSIFGFLEKEYFDMGRGIGEVIGTLIAQVLLLVFTDAIGNLISKGASFLGKAAEFVAGKAVKVFEWVKGLVSEVVSLLRNAVKGALKLFEGLVNKAVEAFDALGALFMESEALVGSETVAAGVGRGVAGPGLPSVMESRMVRPPPRTAPATVADLTPPKVHPSNVPKEVPAPKSTLAEEATAATKPREPFAEDPEFHESIKELEDVPGAKGEPLEDPSRTRTRKQAGVSLEEDHHIATRYLEKNKAIFESAGTQIDADLNMIKEFPEHGQLRGWYDWKNRSYKFHMKGHHPEYNKWVTKTLTDAVPPGLPPDQALNRIVQANQRLEAIIRQYPEVLSHGPDILPPLLRQ